MLKYCARLSSCGVNVDIEIRKSTSRVFPKPQRWHGSRSFVTLCVTNSHNQSVLNLIPRTMSSPADRSGNGLQRHGKGGCLTLRPVQKRRGRSSLNWHDPRGLKPRLATKPTNLDIRGLGAKLCELIGVRSGDTIAFDLLQNGSVRVINCSISKSTARIVCPVV